MIKTESGGAEYRHQENLIICEGIWKIYNEGKPHEVRALMDVGLDIKKGSFVVFKGPSGSGKTTLLSIIGAIDRQSRGRIYLEGRDITDFSDAALSLLRRKRIGFVFQNFNLIPMLSACENISVPLIPQHINERERRNRAKLLLDRFGLMDRANHTPEELSGGEQQRVAIARAMVNNPDIIILDEPTSNIDAEAASLLIDILNGLRTEGKTILASSHDNSLLSCADTIFELSRGRLIDTEQTDFQA